MEVVYLLVALSLIFVGGVVAVFVWAVRHDQFRDLERHGRDVLMDDEPPPPGGAPGGGGPPLSDARDPDEPAAGPR